MKNTFLRSLTGKISIFLVMALTLALFPATTAFAASTYNIDVATGTVGTSQTIEFEYTVDTAQQTWANGDTLTIDIDSILPTWAQMTWTAEYDSDVDNEGDASETAIGAGAGNGEYVLSNSDTRMTIKWNATVWGAVADESSTIRVVITANAAPQYAGTTSFMIGGTTAEAGDTNPFGFDSIVISAADAAASVSLGANSVVGTAGNTTLTFTTPINLANNDTVVFTMPANLDVNNVAFASETFGGAGTFATCTDAAQVITCTTNGAITAGTGNIVMSGITSKYVAAGQTVTNLAVNDVSNAGGDISADASGSVTNTTVGDLTGTNVEPASLIAATSTTHTISFTTTAEIPNLGKIVITYPADWNVSGVAGRTAGGLSGLDGTWTATVSGQVVTLTQTGGAAATAGAKSLTLENIITPSSDGSGGTYTILTKTSADANIETDAAVTADTIIGGSNSSSDISVLDLVEDVEITKGDNSTVVITWSDPSDDSEYIEILRGKNDAPVNGIAYGRVAKGVQKFTDTDVKVGDEISYILRTTDGKGNYGDLSQEFTFTLTAGSAPIIVTEEEVSEDDQSEIAEESEEASNSATEEDTAEPVIQPSEPVLSDISTHWAKDIIMDMVERGIVQGNDDGTFKPDGNLNRAEAATLLYRVLYGEMVPTTPSAAPFSDVAVDQWYAGHVAKLKELAIVAGNPGGTYEPSESINRAEFLTLAMNAYYYNADVAGKAQVDELRAGVVTTKYADVTAGLWYSANVTAATELGFVEGSACGEKVCFNPGASITRAEATTILSRMFPAE